MDFFYFIYQRFRLILLSVVCMGKIIQLNFYFYNLLQFKMPKVVDNYVFQRKIGEGQYGAVYKGYNKNNGADIAIKAIKRQSIKGKFMELLQNQIKVLKTCDNCNIIKLYDIKKTANNFYLILEYCNEGDLMAYLKKKKTLNEEQAVQFLIQILNAFKTLVKHKIMHRDFKLANILMHDGQIKIADFGFSKLLNNEDFAETMLGSPLNMAPEVLGGTQYNTKADIWSIGTCFYQLLFGTPPYKAANMVDLVNNIKNKPLKIPSHISGVVQDVIKKMLVVDPKKRIQWQDLFKHPINNFFEQKIKANMANLNKSQEDQMAMSKFYLQNNKVVNNTKEISKKQDINNYTYQMISKGKAEQPFQGELINRDLKRKQQLDNTQPSITNDNSQSQKDIIDTQQTQKQKQIKAFKRNSNKLLHHRNIYVLLASVGEETMNQSAKYSDIAGYMLIRKLVNLLEWLKTKIQNKKQFPGMDYWGLFVQTKDYQDIRNYIQKQYSVFRIFSSSVHNKIKGSIKDLDPQTQSVYNNPNSPLTEKVYQKILREYVRGLNLSIKEKKFQSEGEQKKIYIHMSKIIDCLSLQQVFQYEKDGLLFNFRNYYSEAQRVPTEQLKKEVQKKLSII